MYFKMLTKAVLTPGLFILFSKKKWPNKKKLEMLIDKS